MLILLVERSFWLICRSSSRRHLILSSWCRFIIVAIVILKVVQRFKRFFWSITQCLMILNLIFVYIIFILIVHFQNIFFNCRILRINSWSFTWFANNWRADNRIGWHCNGNNTTCTWKNQSSANSWWWSPRHLIYWYIWIIWTVCPTIIYKNTLISAQVLFLIYLFGAYNTSNFRFRFLSRCQNFLSFMLVVLGWY